jgi:hypothetical protein
MPLPERERGDNNPCGFTLPWIAVEIVATAELAAVQIHRPALLLSAGTLQHEGAVLPISA